MGTPSEAETPVIPADAGAAVSIVPKSLTLDEVREIGAIAHLAGCTDKIETHLKGIHLEQEKALTARQTADLAPYTKNLELLWDRLQQAQDELTEADGKVHSHAETLLQLRCDEARMKSQILGIVLRVRAHLKEVKTNQLQEDRARNRVEAEAEYDRRSIDWAANAEVRRQKVASLKQYQCLLDARIARVAALLANWEDAGFSVKVERFLLWMSYLIWPALGMIFASLLNRAKVDGGGLLDQSDPLHALAQIVQSAVNDPGTWFTHAGVYLAVIVGLAFLTVFLVIAFDWLLRRFDPNWTQRRRQPAAKDGDAVKDLLTTMQGLFLPSSEARATVAEPQDRQTYVGLLTRIPFLILSAIVFYLAIQLTNVESKSIPPSYLLVGMMVPLISAGTGVLLGLYLSTRPARLPGLPGVLVFFAVSAPFAIALLPAVYVWTIVAAYLSLAMILIGLATVHRGMGSAHRRMTSEQLNVLRQIANLEEVFPKSVFVQQYLAARQRPEKTVEPPVANVVLNLGPRLPRWVAGPLLRLLPKPAPADQQTESTTPEQPKEEDKPIESPVTETLNDPLMSRPGIPEELRAAWEMHRTELEVVIEKIIAAIGKHKERNELEEDVERLRTEWRNEANTLAKHEAEWASRVAALKAEQAQQMLAFALAAQIARESVVLGGKPAMKGAAA